MIDAKFVNCLNIAHRYKPCNTIFLVMILLSIWNVLINAQSLGPAANGYASYAIDESGILYTWG